MNDEQIVEIDVLAAGAYTRSAANGFWEQFPNRFDDERSWIGEKVALAHTELSEIIDASRKLTHDDQRYLQLLKELGDTIWRCLDMAYVIHQFDGLPEGVTLGSVMYHQAEGMAGRGRLHGGDRRW